MKLLFSAPASTGKRHGNVCRHWEQPPNKQNIKAAPLLFSQNVHSDILRIQILNSYFFPNPLFCLDIIVPFS